MSLETLSPFALRRSLLSARTVDDLAAAAADVPKLFVDLIEANLDAPALTRILTLLSDAATVGCSSSRSDVRRATRSTMLAGLRQHRAQRAHLASDQDNGLAYADTDDPTVDEYFRRVADRSTRAGLRRLRLDTHGALAQNGESRMAASAWVGCLRAVPGRPDNDRPARGRVAVDFSVRRAASLADRSSGSRGADPAGDAKAPAIQGWACGLWGEKYPVAAGLRQRWGPVDMKKSGSFLSRNMARRTTSSPAVSPRRRPSSVCREEERGRAVADQPPRSARPLSHVVLRLGITPRDCCGTRLKRRDRHGGPVCH